MKESGSSTKNACCHQDTAYGRAGVDIDAGAALVDRIKPFARATDRPGTMGGLGGFGALFDLKAAGFHDPILVSSTDGVGTKLKIAIETGRHDTVGIDLVAMCVNDLIVQGATPLFFLDYFATGKLDVGIGSAVIGGIAKGCEQAQCALIGGETAEMPGLYGPGDYDLAGFTVGAVERARLVTGDRVEAGDVVLGLTSSGVHSNGFSLVRKLVRESGVEWNEKAPFDPARTLGEAFLTPTRIYVRPVLQAMTRFDLRALAHITGGGLLENIPRVLPDGLGVRLDAGAWPLLPVFKWMRSVGELSETDLARTFNCGLGMVLIVPEAQQSEIRACLEAQNETVFCIGRVERMEGAERVKIEGADKAWT